MEATIMKALSLISTGVLVLLLGAVAPSYAQESKPDDSAKPAAKQEETKPAAKQEEAKPAAKQEETKPVAKQEEAKPEAKHQEADHAQQSQGQYARNGQKDSRGHEYTTSKFGPDHHARFAATGGRFTDGRREYSYGGSWVYAGTYPPW